MKESDIDNIVSFNFAYADDLTVIDSDENKILSFINLIKNLGPKYGLVINENKTDWIIMKEGEFVKENVLLGAWIGSFDKAVELRLKKAKISFWIYYDKLWKLKNVNPLTKMRIFNAVCLSTLFYGLESVALNEILSLKIESFIFESYRIILGINKFQNLEVNYKRTSKDLVWKECRKLNKNFVSWRDILCERRIANYCRFRLRVSNSTNRTNILRWQPMPKPGKRFRSNQTLILTQYSKDSKHKPELICKNCKNVHNPNPIPLT